MKLARKLQPAARRRRRPHRHREHRAATRPARSASSAPAARASRSRRSRKLSRGDARYLKVGADDTVILSSHPIPGNEWSVGRVIDDLHRAAAEVIHSGHEPVHASGHARQGELRTFHQLLRPKNFVPGSRGVSPHGPPRRTGATPWGSAPSTSSSVRTVTRSTSTEKGIRRAGKVPAGFHYIDGSAGDLDERPLEERRMLAEFGVLQISAGVDQGREARSSPSRFASPRAAGSRATRTRSS